MDTSNLKFSIIIPTYNRANTVVRAIESTVNQSTSDYETIVVDDGSTDNTQDTVQSFDKPNIRYVKQEQQGANAARNRGIKLAKGDLITFLDSDDEIHSDYLKTVQDELRNLDNSCGGAFTSYRKLKDGSVTEFIEVPNRQITFDDIRDKNIIGGFSGTTFRSEVFETVGPLDEKLVSSQDYDFYLRVLKYYNMKGISKILVDYHIHNQQISQDIKKKILGQDQIIEKHGQYLSKKRFANNHHVRGMMYANIGESYKARKEFKKAITYRPKYPVYYLHYIATFGGKSGHTWLSYLKDKYRILWYKVRSISME